MPLKYYFMFVGGVLLALLFVSDAYLPKLPVAREANSDLPIIIRIHSDRKWPERVVYDTSLPTIIPAHTANGDTGVPAPTTIAGVSAKPQVRDAFAQMQPSGASQLKSSDPKKPELKLQRQRKIAKRRAAPQMVLMAQHRQFGWFGNNLW